MKGKMYILTTGEFVDGLLAVTVFIGFFVILIAVLTVAIKSLLGL